MASLIIFIIILSVLVVIHELGHFYAAKKQGVRVDEFGFGLPPKVWGKKFGETTYTINLLPFGGFVKVAGEDESAEITEDMLHDPRNFNSKTVGQRALIIAAGVIMNIVLAMFLYYVFFMVNGFRSFNLPMFYDYNFRFGAEDRAHTVILSYEVDYPADLAGINPGEAILEVDKVPVYSINDIRTQLAPKADTEVKILLSDLRSTDKSLRTVSVFPVADENGNGILGVYIGDSVTLDYNHNRLLSAPKHTYNMLAYSISTLRSLIKDSLTQRTIEPVSSSVSGPVGIFGIVDSILDYANSLPETQQRAKFVFLGLLDLTAILSISLAFVNILPIPALDGGRLMFLAIEKVKGSRVNPKYEAALHKVGIVLLLLLLAAVTIRDIGRLL